jgi:glutathione synthase/RimK-type ligase-like ATP-grasp enzyme
MSKMYIRELVLSTPWLKKIYLMQRSKSENDLMNTTQLQKYLNEAEKVILERPVNLKVGLVKDADNYADEGLVKERAYYPKYERFLKNNNINYSYYDPYRSDWIEKAENYDLIIWHTDSDPSTQDIAKSKIYILEKMGKHCLPSYEEIWSYEDKIRAHYLYKLYKLPAIPTFVSHSKSEIIDYLKSAKYPLISKISTGSASFGVDKLDNYDQAKKVVDQVFCYKGKETYFKYSCQKDYIYFQDFIEDATYDLRVMSVGNELFGYYRYPNKGDFRASGAGNYEKKGIPNEALELAYQVKEKFGSSFLATDFVYSEKLKKFLIIESSIFIGIDTCEQLSIDGIAGKYVRISENRFEFKPGKYWVQELTLKNVIEKITK